MHQATWSLHMSIQTKVVRLYKSLLWNWFFWIWIMKHYDTNFVSFDYSIFTPHRHAHKTQSFHWWSNLKHNSTIQYAAEINLLASNFIHLETTQISTWTCHSSCLVWTSSLNDNPESHIIKKCAPLSICLKCTQSLADLVFPQFLTFDDTGSRGLHTWYWWHSYCLKYTEKT